MFRTAMKLWIATVAVLITTQAFAGTGRISGTVVDESRVPVKHINVQAFPLDSDWTGAVPQATTDERGSFTIVVPVSGSTGLCWRVYAHEEDQYYPELSAQFYQTHERMGTVVQLDAGDPETTVQIQLERKAGALKAKVTDAATGSQLKSVHCELAWADNQGKWFRIETAGEYFTVLLPSNIDVTVTVSSPGYQPWTYPGAINVGPGQDLPLDIQLQPANLIGGELVCNKAKER